MNLDDYQRIIFTHGCPLCGENEMDGLHVVNTIPDEQGGVIEPNKETVLIELYCHIEKRSKTFNPNGLEIFELERMHNLGPKALQ